MPKPDANRIVYPERTFVSGFLVNSVETDPTTLATTLTGIRPEMLLLKGTAAPTVYRKTLFYTLYFRGARKGGNRVRVLLRDAELDENLVFMDERLELLQDEIHMQKEEIKFATPGPTTFYVCVEVNDRDEWSWPIVFRR